MKRRLPGWWIAVASLLLLLWATTTLWYHLGAKGVDFDSGSIDFQRQHDFKLFRLSDRAALLVGPGGFLSVVKYGRGMIPFCPLCGLYESRGSIVNLVRYHKDDWIYTDFPGPFSEIYNVKTGEAIDVKATLAPGESKLDLATIPEYRTRGLNSDVAYKITPGDVRRSWPTLSTINESCIVFNAAFLLLTGFWLVVGVLALLRRRRVSLPSA
jgi:hypothetical protein